MPQRPFSKLKKHGPTNLYMLYPMAQSAARVCVESRHGKGAGRALFIVIITKNHFGARPHQRANKRPYLQGTGAPRQYPHTLIFCAAKTFVIWIDGDERRRWCCRFVCSCCFRSCRPRPHSQTHVCLAVVGGGALWHGHAIVGVNVWQRLSCHFLSSNIGQSGAMASWNDVDSNGVSEEVINAIENRFFMHL
jgi:hypothetical protein